MSPPPTTKLTELAADGVPHSMGQRNVRKMERSELMGQHTHETVVGVSVQIYRRNDSYIARGRYQGRYFGETLDRDPTAAAQKLRRLLVEIEDGAFIRSSERSKRQIRCGTPPRLSIRNLGDAYLADVRQRCGKNTTDDYRSRLTPLIEFAEAPSTRRQWPFAQDADSRFALTFRTQLDQRLVSPNGRAASKSRRISPRHRFNVLDSCRTLFNWAKSLRVNLLPAWIINPFDGDIVGRPPEQDPLRPSAFPLNARIVMVAGMDCWQLLHLTWPLVLPLRPEDFAGLLIDEVDVRERFLQFGSRFRGADHNKGHQTFKCPVPEELDWLLQRTIDDRPAGPLLRSRSAWEEVRRPRVVVESVADVELKIEAALTAARPGELQAPADYKRFVRRCIMAMGGVSEDMLGKECKALLKRVGLDPTLRAYSLRRSITTELSRAGVREREQEYVTGHVLKDVMFNYDSLDPQREMRKYFDTLAPLFDAVCQRACELGLTTRVEG